ncbi:21080ea4-f04f-4601-98a4-d2bfe25ac136 [Thermothielavioides terrestris]|uniref:21080ea4-f04f-4601-98a4-d2bfe25ac136 n=1 Tax=Thermothielavioides terrestris TaxID=2587410 RepID=A0A446BPN0_9PEZI|nr:21080ea4-f04f-4601-98a4-d2bfe25ac136 [Thermothielavioides terrestris]
MSMHGPSPSSELPEKLLDPSPNAPWPGNERNTNVPAMILRNFGVRHGRRALAAPISRSCLRSLSNSASRTTAAPTTLAEPPAPSATTTAPLNTYGTATAKAAARQAELAQIPANFAAMQHQREHTRTVGSRVESRYHPDQMLLDPPHDVTLEMLMAAQAHMGHHVSQWNPGTQRYIYGERAGIHIISLETTAAHLRRAARVVEEVAYLGGLILFVGNRKGQVHAVVRAAELARGCHLFQKWTPGAITNRDVILASARLKIVGERDQELPGFEEHLRDRRPILPDLVVCLNPLENYVLLHECSQASIPTIGIIDTDADPTWVTYQIPANDDSLRAVTLIAGVLGRAGERGQQRRLAAANEGIVTWRNPDEVALFIQKDADRKLTAAKAAAEEAMATGELDEKPLQREDFLTDDELLREMYENPLLAPPSD